MFYVLLLVLIELGLFTTNYIHGTYLIGWDNVMPEFNLPLNLQRALFSVWQEYRGLGLPDGMAHAANLMHTIYIGFLSLFLPQAMLRYVFIFLTHLIGGISFFFLAKKLTQSQKASFLAALFYMFNLGVVQMYFAPLEVFAVHFAALPILTIFILNAFTKPDRKNLLFLFIISFLTSPQGFVPTVFLAFLILFLTIGIFYFRQTKNLKRVVILGLIIFCANAFWILPYAYNVIGNAGVIQNTRINQFSSEEIFYRNFARGDLLSVLSLKGFMLDAIEFNHLEGKDAFFMLNWRNYISSPFYILGSFLLLTISFLGIILALVKKQKKYFPFFASLVISFAFLANNTLFIEQINLALRFIFPLFGEAFRFPFTKFITLYVFCLAVFFALGLTFILGKIKSFEKYLLIVLSVLILALASPSFQGNFVSPMLKLKLPSEYLETISYFKSQDKSKRIALFPVQSYWNWQFRSWGHRGSGFLWYGIEQPLLDRAFDPWSNYNEQFFNEISYAVKSNDKKLFQNVFTKYNISFLLLDEYIRDVSTQQPIDYEKLKLFLDASDFLKKEKQFGKIAIYKTKEEKSSLSTLSNSALSVYPNFQYEKNDSLYQYAPNYIVDSKNPDVLFLFPSLYTEKLQENLEFEVKNEADKFTLIPKKKFFGKGDYFLEIPSLFQNEFLIPVTLEIKKGEIELIPTLPKIYINKSEINLKEQPFIIKPAVVKNPKTMTFVDIGHTVQISKDNLKSYLLNDYPNAIKLEDDFNQEILIVDTRGVAKESYFLQAKADKINSIEIEVEKIQSPLSESGIVKNDAYKIKQRETSFYPYGEDTAFASFKKENDGVTLKARNDNIEIVFYRENLLHEASYILFAKTGFKSGLPLNFYIDNPLELRYEIDTRLSKNKNENIIVLPKTEEYFKGYGFHFILKSVGKEIAESTVKEIEYYPFPYSTIKNIKLVRSDLLTSIKSNNLKPLESKKINNYLYQCFPQNNGYVVLDQAFDGRWKAFAIENSKWQIANSLQTVFPFLFSNELKEHVVINNWANGWLINSSKFKVQSSKLVIIFWPQYLEFAGFGLLIIGLLFILIKRDSTGNTKVANKHLSVGDSSSLASELTLRKSQGSNIHSSRSFKSPPSSGENPHNNLQ